AAGAVVGLHQSLSEGGLAASGAKCAGHHLARAEDRAAEGLLDRGQDIWTRAIHVDIRLLGGGFLVEAKEVGKSILADSGPTRSLEDRCVEGAEQALVIRQCIRHRTVVLASV